MCILRGISRTVQICDATNGVHVFTYKGHTAGIDIVVWSPNGKYIASGGVDMTV